MTEKVFCFAGIFHPACSRRNIPFLLFKHFAIMEPRKNKPQVIPNPEQNPEFNPEVAPEPPLSPEEALDYIPDEEELYDDKPYEAPEPGEGP
jgi:hypothetical protein